MTTSVKGSFLFTYLHLAAEPSLAQALKDKGVIAIAYETVAANRTLPLLTPMSEVAGRMAAQIGSQFLQKNQMEVKVSCLRVFLV
ncbi:hypothetical protein GCM10020331_001830 [Ectobacillus funiculus]